MKEIIEKQKIKAFLNKVQIVWSNEIDFFEFIDDRSINIHLKDDITVIGLSNILIPKINMFVDFETPLTLKFIDQNQNTYILEIINKKYRTEE